MAVFQDLEMESSSQVKDILMVGPWKQKTDMEKSTERGFSGPNIFVYVMMERKV